MKKKIFFFLFLSLFILSVFADDIVISRSQLADFKEQMKTAYGYTPDELYRFYNQNAVKFENDFKYKAFKNRLCSEKVLIKNYTISKNVL